MVMAEWYQEIVFEQEGAPDNTAAAFLMTGLSWAISLESTCDPNQVRCFHVFIMLKLRFISKQLVKLYIPVYIPQEELPMEFRPVTPPNRVSSAVQHSPPQPGLSPPYKRTRKQTANAELIKDEDGHWEIPSSGLPNSEDYVGYNDQISIYLVVYSNTDMSRAKRNKPWPLGHTGKHV